MADWSKPTLTSTYTNFLSELNGRLNDLAVGMDASATNIPTNTIRWSSSNNKWQKWNGSAWVDLSTQYAVNVYSATRWTTGRTISLTGDVSGTSSAWDGSANLSFSTTLATVNSNVGTYGSSSAVPVVTVDAKGRVTAVSTAALASMAVQSSSNVNITGGSISGVSLNSSSVTITGGSISNLSSPLAIGSGGTGASTWQTALAALGSPLSTYIDRSSNFTVGSGDKGKLFGCTNTITATLPTASSVGQGFVVGVRNNGSGTVTIACSGSDTIDGATSVQLFSGTSCIVVCTGTGWYTVGRQQGGVVNVQTFSSSGTWYKPAVGTMALIECWGGGGSGNGSGSAILYGGNGGIYASRLIPLTDLPSSVSVTVGAGGAAVSSSSTQGNNGENTSFGSYVFGHGGFGGGVSVVGRTGGGNPGFYFLVQGYYYIIPGQSNPISGGGAARIPAQGVSARAGNSYWGGGGGGIQPGDMLAGTSIMGGNGGSGNGYTPGGGGGCGYSGGNGYCRVTVF